MESEKHRPTANSNKKKPGGSSKRVSDCFTRTSSTSSQSQEKTCGDDQQCGDDAENSESQDKKDRMRIIEYGAFSQPAKVNAIKNNKCILVS